MTVPAPLNRPLRIGGKSLSNTLPTDGQALQFASATDLWQPATPAAGTVTSVTGTAPIASSGGATPAISLNDAGVTLAKMADIATARIIGRTTAATGVPEALTTAQATALLDAATATLKGMVPTPPNNTTTFLRGDATFAAPASSGALTRAGGNTTEATTTSTSAVDLMTISSLNITASTAWSMVGSYRKTIGAAADAGLGLAINATVVSEVSVGSTRLSASLGGGNAAQSGGFWVVWSGVQTDYNKGGMGLAQAANDVGVVGIVALTAAAPVATITQVVIRGASGNASVTLASDDVHVYSYAVS